MLKVFFMFSILMSMMSYVNIDPMKSSFFLIFSLLFCVPLMSFSTHIWFSYFVCLLFLSGIFVILVYFSSLSKFSLNKSYFYLLSFFITMYVFCFEGAFLGNYLNLSGFYFGVYWFMFFFILGMLVFFMNFSSYFLNFSGALRKV